MGKPNGRVRCVTPFSSGMTVLRKPTPTGFHDSHRSPPKLIHNKTRNRNRFSNHNANTKIFNFSGNLKHSPRHANSLLWIFYHRAQIKTRSQCKTQGRGIYRLQRSFIPFVETPS
jgi:hypothetical protein